MDQGGVETVSKSVLPEIPVISGAQHVEAIATHRRTNQFGGGTPYGEVALVSLGWELLQ